jgi:DNA-directed RNA polymerase specialized sigma24 family protein
MPFPEADQNLDAAGAEHFATTRWTAVLTAGQAASPRADEALAFLCRTYWYPLYAFVRRQGYETHDAQDLTQEFFARLLAKHYLEKADRRRGKFRSFLLAALKHFLANEWDRVRAAKRGGGQTHISLDDPHAEERYRLEAANSLTADKLYERRWALALLERALTRLRQDFSAAGKAKLFDHLKVFLTAESAPVSHAEMASALGQTEGAIKVTVHRMRQRYRELVREEIAHTVASPSEIDEELNDLLAALRQ